MTSPRLNSDSNKINNNVDPNFGSNSATQALTSACIIVPVVCFVGTVVIVLLGVTMCKMNKTCDKCLLLRMFQGRERDFTDVTRPVYARTLETERNLPQACPTCNHTLLHSDPQDARGISNPLYNGFGHVQLNSPEGICMSTLKPGVGFERNSINGDSEFDTFEASKIVNCGGSSLEKRSVPSSGDLYQERIQTFLGDPVLTFHKACRPALVPVHSRERVSSFHAGSSSLLTLNTFVDDSSHTEFEVDSLNSSFFENRPLSDVSRIVHYSRSLIGRPNETVPVAAQNLHIYRHTVEEHEDLEIRNFSSDSQESFSTTYLRAPPPSPNTDNLPGHNQSENSRHHNEALGQAATRHQNVLVEERTQGSRFTAQSIDNREESLEWDNYQPSLDSCFSSFATQSPETPSTLVLAGNELM